MGDANRVSMAEQFLPSVDKLDSGDVKRVMRSVSRFGKDPNHSSLNLHPVKTDSSERLYSFRASDDLRILAASLGDNTWVVLEAGHHDALYLRASLGRFVAAADGSSLGFYTADDAELDRRRGEAGAHVIGTSPEVGTVLSHWTDAELRDVGFEDDEIEAIRACLEPSELLDLDLDDERAELAIDLIELTPETYARRKDTDTPRATTRELVETVERAGADWGLSSFLEPDELERLVSAPIERWMLFLHPNQKALVSRSYEGPARLAGPAGTGKTVVALHRTAALARRLREEDPTARILFTTFVSTLPPVFESLYGQLPNAVPGAVDFVNIDSLARQVCADAGVPARASAKAADACFDEAVKRIVKPTTPLGKLGVSPDYLREEINSVLKGGGIERREDYLVLERTGRRTPLLPQHREQIWELREVYDGLLERDGVMDHPDVLASALDALDGQRPRYRSAIIDESQDLSLVGLQLVRKLVNGTGPDRPDGLLLVGDGAQRIYSSCFSLRQAGLEVRGRSTVLQHNYRNSKEILDAAIAVAGDREIDDFGEARRRSAESVAAMRTGEKPRLVIVADQQARGGYIADRITALARSSRIGTGDIAVLVPTNRLVWGLTKGLRERGIEATALQEYDGTVSDGVKVGTYWRAKGLEFKAVILLGTERFPRNSKKAASDPAAEDRLDLELSALFVAMTRAREHLDVVSIGEPTEQVQAGASAFDLVDRR